MRLFYSITTVQTPKRDIDLFGPTTVRIDGSREPGGSGAPVVYLSAYVSDPDRFAQRLAAALCWLDDTAQQPNRVEAAAPVQDVGPYAMPDYVEDVDWEERLFLPEDLATTDWKAWTSAFERRVDLAGSSTQIATLEATNALGLRACPGGFRAPLGRKLHARYIETADQVAA